MTNDFEGPVVREHPEIERLRDALHESGATYVSLSGSGSAVYAVFAGDRKETRAEEVQDRIERRFDSVRVHLTRTPGIHKSGQEEGA